MTWGNIGRSLFERCEVTIDLAQGRLRAHPYTPEELAAAKRGGRVGGSRAFGTRMRAGAGELVVEAVDPGSLAERAGVKPGDVLLAVDEEQISPRDSGPLRAALADGKAFTLIVERGGEILELAVAGT